MNSYFWKGKKVFLTGHTGFKGGWLSLWLQHIGADVKGFSLEPPASSNSLFIEARVSEGMRSEIGDIRDYEVLYQSIKEFSPEIIFHLAAQPIVRLSYDIPVETYATNVMGTVHLFDIVRKLGGVRAVINVTSDKCYDNQEWVWGYRENEPMGGYDPYSNSKGCSELVTSAFRNSYFNDNQYLKHQCALASARAGNVIGGGDWANDRLIPDILKSFSEDRAALIRYPYAIRPWQHVLEPLSGYLVLAERLYDFGSKYAEAWNFGPKEGEERPVNWIVAYLAKVWGENAAWLEDNKEHPHEAHFLKLDCSKSRAQLAWKSKWGIEYTLNKIIEWHKAWLKNEDMRQYTLNEIEEYVAT
jgi:CDP-glucose 4,6-dehydratase